MQLPFTDFLVKGEGIGELSVKWNWLVGEYDKPTDDIKVLHWTLDGPYFKEYLDTDFSDEWTKEFKAMTFVNSISNLKMCDLAI